MSRAASALHDPSALFGCSLAEGFKKAVLENHQVRVALQSTLASVRISSDERTYCEAIRVGRFPGVHGGYRWPLDLEAKSLAHHFARRALMVLGDPRSFPDPSAEIEQLSSLIVARLAVLKNHLESGRVLARGTYSLSGNIALIDPPQWARTGTFIDVRNSDFIIELEPKSTLHWTGVWLFEPTAVKDKQRSSGPMFHVKHMPSDIPPQDTTLDDTVRSNRKVSPSHASVAQAIASLWPTGIPDSISVQVRNQRIIAWQKANDVAVVSERTISRYLKGLG